MSNGIRERASAILVIGAGGLGCPALEHLASSGVWRLGIADYDRVETSNLPRQLLYGDADIGRLKVEVARERLLRLPGAPSMRIDIHEEMMRGNEGFIEEYSVVIDATDRADVKLALHDAVVARGISFIHAAASGWLGQGLTIVDPGCLRCLFGSAALADAPDCRTAGIFGPVVGLVGLGAAEEALRVVSGRRPRWKGAFWSIDAREGRERVTGVAPDPECSVCRLRGEAKRSSMGGR